MKTQTKVFSVTQINHYLREVMRRDVLLHKITICGEVSNCTYHGSGHIYFTLKDKTATLSCVMFASDRAGLSFTLTDGTQVQVEGRIDVYPLGGRYQLYAQRITTEGEGALYEAFLRLKERLSEEGLFAEEYKRSIPPFVKTLGVVTAPTGAAVRDIIRNALRRNPYLQIIVYPALVQGEGAPASVVKGIETLSRAGCDVLIVGRGGGSFEDLHAFNDESVARAIFDSPVPVISGVGHETDFTIADFVADLRAPTPSTAAELAVFEYARFEETVDGLRASLQSLMDDTIVAYREAVADRKKSLSYLSPSAKLRDLKMRSAHTRDRLSFAMRTKIDEKRTGLLVRTERLQGLSPARRLEAGYALVTDEDGRQIKSASCFAKDQRIRVILSDGSAGAVVQDVTRNTEDGSGSEKEN